MGGNGFGTEMVSRILYSIASRILQPDDAGCRPINTYGEYLIAS